MAESHKVYLSGSMVEEETTTRWREDIKSANASKNLDFIDPFEFEWGDDDSRVQTQLKLVKDKADAVLVHYEEGHESWQPSTEMFIASLKDKPVVVWTGQYQAPKENLDPTLRHYADSIHKNGRDALNQLLRTL